MDTFQQETVFALGNQVGRKETNDMKATCPMRSIFDWCVLRLALALAL